MRLLLSLAVALSGCLVLGCGAKKLNYSKSFTIGGDKIADISIMNPEKTEQNVSISITSTDAVDVYVLLSKDLPGAEDKSWGDWEKAAVAKQKGVKGDALRAKIPAGQEWKVILTTGMKMGKASGTLKITN